MARVDTLTEIQRLLQNLIRFGTIAEVDHDSARCRVQSGDVLTAWLPWLTLHAGSTVVTWSSPALGEQVVLLSPGGDLCSAVALHGLYSAAVPAPSNQPTLHTERFDDGAVIEYDCAAHTLRVVLPADGTATLTAPGGVTVIGDVQITGDVAITGKVEASVDVTADGISLKNHVHGGVQAGGADSGPPK